MTASPLDPIPRLLGATGEPLDLAAHLAQHGPAPRPGAALVATVEEAGLTGRGGAGFPTGRKLRAVAAQRRRWRGRPVVVANGMESEPLSRKDSTLLDVSPHLVLDGAVLAAEAVGADRVHLCVPRTRAGQLRALTAAVDERRAAGLDSVPVRVEAAPHGYVTSESSALVQWLDGGPARPTTAPPRSHEKGVRGRPTLVQNVETLAHLALIARHGAQWFRRAGTAASPGTVLITVTGAVRRPAVLETDPGTPLGTLLRQAGGAERPLQAVLVGGFAGTWLPLPHALRRPFDREGLAPHAAPGAGVIAALPQDACPLAETARILAYLAAGGARQCGPCRFGLPAVAEDVTALAEGRATPELLDRLRHRVGLLPGRGACGHPDGAARLAAGALTVFRADVERHLHHGSCHRATALAVPPATPTEEWR
ncbi:NADH-ubiquinone oxidoreductase-F iron-sulfur binding region domain-containing protein [Streptomyces sp. SP17BM10]|uniref:NADH-ubiquinone oxidoreductase-F iron-sulfur binding region domain-containing protein n=1 Tax=Streptomyces sp. SP17BM10 TaxID=3002530 RepID=UPI002E78035C|nr:NADH-ubiquinone oxidoreductase-F iron-sulfur binding region domain-containing protein [Streptomyces sp. SP17BM10]MEE1783199.1 NADH-ubiquinone oxidoreductase-F iron-sulfur binding region domain-containing protein [Streptomyces sp. SP17BM10]